MTRVLWAAAAALVLLASQAQAHVLKVFAEIEGGVIVGEAYFGGGKVAVNKPVLVMGPDGTKIGEAVTDAAGKFTYVPKSRVDHTFVIEGEEGHRGEWTIEADTLPKSVGGK